MLRNSADRLTMLNLLTESTLSGADSAMLSAALQEGPWGWPVSDANLTTAVRDLLSGGPPPERNGATLLLGHHRDATQLWSLHFDGARGSRLHTAVISPETREVWNQSVAIAFRNLPVQWRAISPNTLGYPTAVNIAANIHATTLPEVNSLTDGSFGLSFVLALASMVLDVPIPSHIVATASINIADDCLGSVAHLRHKVDAVRKYTPRVSEILVSPEMAAEDQGQTNPRVVGVSTVSDAIAHVFGSKPEELLRHAGRAPAERNRILGEFRHVEDAVRGDWKAIARAGALMLSEWPELGPADREMIASITGTAQRHCNNGGYRLRPAVTREQLLAITPDDRRMNDIAQRIQDATDGDECNPPDIIAVAREAIPADEHCMHHHFVVMGALGRYHAIAGRPTDAIRLLETATRGFLNHPRSTVDASRPLAEWIRLGGCTDLRTLKVALEQAERWNHYSPDRRSRGFIALATARAYMRLDENLSFAEELLREPIMMEGDKHVGWGALRSLIALSRRRSRISDAEQYFAELQAKAHADPSARRHHIMARLDMAIESKQREGVSVIIDELRNEDPGLCARLTRAAGYSDLPRYIQLWYPY